MNIQTLTARTRTTLTDDGRIFGLRKAEMLFIGLMAGGFATGCAGLDHWEDLTHLKIVMSIVLQLGGAAVAFATGRMSK